MTTELLELCKTRTKKSSPDMFIFYVILAGHDMRTDAGRATTCGRKIKAHQCKQKVQKMRDIPKVWVSTWKPFEDFRRNKIKKFATLHQTTPWNRQFLKAYIDDGTGNQEGINRRKIEKTSQWKIYFGLFFLVLTNMTNVKEQLIGAQNVYWQVLCMLDDRFFRT